VLETPDFKPDALPPNCPDFTAGTTKFGQ